MTTPPPFRRPPGRYDEPAPPSRRAALAFGLVFAVVVTLLAVKVWRQYSSDGVRVQVRGFVVSSEREVRVQYDVRKDAGRAAQCRLRALDRDGALTGSAVVEVGPRADGAATTRVDTPVPTRARAITAEVLGCRLLPARP